MSFITTEYSRNWHENAFILALDLAQDIIIFFKKKKEIPIFIFNPLKGLKNKNQPYREYKLSLDLTITWLPDEEQTRAQTQNDLIIELLELTKTSESVQQCIPPTLRTWFFVVGFSRPFLKLLVSQILFQEKRHGSD